MAQHDLVTHPLTVRRLEVSRARDITPRMRRVTLIGPELDAFSRDGFDLPAFASEAFDDHVKLVFAADGDIAAALPVQRARSIDWPPSEQRQGRDYTPRRWDPVRRELDLDFVLHGDGPAVRWASAAQPGDHLHVVGPKSSLVLPDDIDWILLAGDETALPAIGRFLDERPLPVPVQIVLELRDEAARQELPLRDGDRLQWIVTTPAAPSALAATISELPWWKGKPYAWVAGESRSLLPLRRWLRRDRGLEPSHVNVTGYWHAEEDEGSAGSAATVDAETLLSPLPWLATKAAIELGLLDTIGEVPTTASSLANQLGVEVGALRPLLAYLAAVRVLLAADDAYALGPIAQELLGDDHLQNELFGVEARGMEALSQLAPALRSGSAPWQLATGTSLAVAVENTPELYVERTEAAGVFAFVAGGVPDLPVWQAVERLTVTGPGAIALLAAAHSRGLWPMDVIICAPPMALDVLRRQGRNLPLRYAAGPDVPGSDLVISTLEVGFRTDEELVARLRELARHANRALVIDALDHTGPGSPGGAAERKLIDLGGVGRGPRDADELTRLAAVAGWQLKEQVKLGWDFEVFDLVR